MLLGVVGAVVVVGTGVDVVGGVTITVVARIVDVDVDEGDTDAGVEVVGFSVDVCGGDVDVGVLDGRVGCCVDCGFPGIKLYTGVSYAAPVGVANVKLYANESALFIVTL